MERLDKDINAPPAGETHLPGRFVCYAKMQKPRLILFHGIKRGFHHRVLHAAATDRARELPVGGNHHLRSHAARRRAPRLDNGGKCQLLSLRPPAVYIRKNITHTASGLPRLFLFFAAPHYRIARKVSARQAASGVPQDLPIVLKHLHRLSSAPVYCPPRHRLKTFRSQGLQPYLWRYHALSASRGWAHPFQEHP